MGENCNYYYFHLQWTIIIYAAFTVHCKIKNSYDHIKTNFFFSQIKNNNKYLAGLECGIAIKQNNFYFYRRKV